MSSPAVLQQSEARMARMEDTVRRNREVCEARMVSIEDTVRRNREVLERDLTATRRWMMALFACIVFLLSTLSEMNNKIETMEEKQKLHDQIMEYHDRKMSALENHPLLQGEDKDTAYIHHGLCSRALWYTMWSVEEGGAAQQPPLLQAAPHREDQV